MLPQRALQEQSCGCSSWNQGKCVDVEIRCSSRDRTAVWNVVFSDKQRLKCSMTLWNDQQRTSSKEEVPSRLDVFDIDAVARAWG